VSLRTALFVLALAACGPGSAPTDAAIEAAPSANPFACSGPCASGCCQNGACINLEADLAHCGRCGNACGVGQVCRAGRCD
jgi:hypothetical protein